MPASFARGWVVVHRPRIDCGDDPGRERTVRRMDTGALVEGRVRDEVRARGIDPLQRFFDDPTLEEGWINERLTRVGGPPLAP